MSYSRKRNRLKSVELSDSNMALTPVNQIRYGFKHLTQAFRAYENDNHNEYESNILKSEGHCKRSYYDAVDVEIVFHIEQFDKFVQNSHEKGISISSVIPEYKTWVSIVSKTKKFIAHSSQIENKDDRYNEITKLLNDLKEVSDNIPGAYEVINEKLILEQKLQEELKISKEEALKSANIARKNHYVAIIAVCVAAITSIIHVLNYFTSSAH